MVYIHGGAFVEGSGNDNFYGPDFLLNEDVVLVIHRRIKYDLHNSHSSFVSLTCLLIVLKQGNVKLSFGSARIHVAGQPRIFWEYGTERPKFSFKMGQKQYRKVRRRC